MPSARGVENTDVKKSETSNEPTVTDRADGPESDEFSPDDGYQISQADAFEVLSNRRRRYAIHALKHADEPLDLSELSTRVTAWELDVDREAVDYEDRRNIHTTLRQIHLPKLEEKRMITIDDETDIVRETPLLDDLEVYTEVLQNKEIPWSLYYVGLAGVSVAIMLAVVLGAPGFTALSPLNVAVFTATAFGISSLVHHVLGRRMRLGSTEKPPELRRTG